MTVTPVGRSIASPPSENVEPPDASALFRPRRGAAVSEIVGHTVRQMAWEINPATKCTRGNKLAEPAESLYGLMIGKHELAAIARKNEDGARVYSFESFLLILKLHP